MMYAWNPDHWHWPQYTVLTLMAINLAFTAALNGEPKMPAKHNFAVTLCAAALSIWIAWAGGFYA